MSSDPEELSPFVYDPLAANEIRLLVPNDNNGLSWTLATFSLTSRLDFDALSYVWGSHTETFPITCNERRLCIQHNLFLALPYLTRRRKNDNFVRQPIWIDAVCINQADEKEKLVQINLMHQIYKRARTVWAWLGLATDQSQMTKVLSLLPLMVEYNKIIRRMGEAEQLDLPVELCKQDPEVWTALLHLFRNPWLERVWVAQEVALAKDIVFLCGDIKVDFTVLRDALDSERIG